MKLLMTVACVLGLSAFVCAEEAGYPGYAALRAKAATLWTYKTTAGGAYVVLVPQGSPLTDAAKKLASYRKGEIVNFSPTAPEECLAALIRKNARYVAIFVEPKDMDVNLLRTFIVLSTLMDSDPFCDFAFGFVTAATPEKVGQFVDRIITADKKGLRDYSVMVCASNISQKYETSFLSGMKGESWYVNQGDTEFAKKALTRLEHAGYVHLGACSDPEGIWLFDDKRNMDASKHWPFDPKKVGQDPGHEMPRITPDYFKDVKLKNALVWSHACHLGAVGRVFVEGDIVSTFGTSDKLEEYRIPEGRSMALAIIDAGASAYICPLGANHGMQSSYERAVAMETGAPLGDVLRRGYHNVVMDTKGHPEQIGLFIAGKPTGWHPDGFINNNAPQHRVLYGDPMFAPFAKKKSPSTVEVTAKEEVGGIRISFKLTASGYDVGRTWYGNRGGDEKGRGRFYEEIPLSGNVDDAWIKEIKTRNAAGEMFSISSHSLLIEKMNGKTILHVQIVTPDISTADYGKDLCVLQQAGAAAEVWVKFGARPSGPIGATEVVAAAPPPGKGHRAKRGAMTNK